MKSGCPPPHLEWDKNICLECVTRKYKILEMFRRLVQHGSVSIRPTMPKGKSVFLASSSSVGNSILDDVHFLDIYILYHISDIATLHSILFTRSDSQGKSAWN